MRVTKVRVLAAAVGLWSALAGPALADFPYAPQGAPDDYAQYRLPPGADRTPSDLKGKLTWMYAATAAPGASPLVLADARELNGIRGAHLADAADVDQGWRRTTGRPDVTIAVLDSGIEWDNRGAMVDLRRKTRLSRGETPVPAVDRTQAAEAGEDCAEFTGDGRDRNGDGVFNVVDYACDSRVDPDPALGVGPADLLDPQDVLIAFTDGVDDDGNGYTDDIVGWDFLDDDNDPFDDVSYGHGTGEARDSAAEAGNDGDLGTCPNCMHVHLRVGTSFIADVNRFALATIYATDNDVQVVQEALGTLNKSRLGADAVRYAYDHGVTVIASAADEAAQHHNWPSSYPYAIVVNSVTHTDEAAGVPGAGSYLQFNGCTNFSSRITLAIPSVSCSSDATGRASGMAGLVYAAALNAIEAGDAEPHPTCKTTAGKPCPISPNEVRQVMASGTVGGAPVADDVDFSDLELSCRPLALPACTDPFLAAPTVRVGTGLSYPAREAHDQFYGYGRVNMVRALDAVRSLPPEVEVTSPGWYDMIDPGAGSLTVEGEVWARGASYRCRVLVAAGSYPSDATDFVPVPSPVCNGALRSERLDGVLGSIAMSDLKGLFPPGSAGDFRGRESGVSGVQPYGGRPNTEPYGFVVKVVATAAAGPAGQDRRQAYLHRDADMLPGFPRQLPGDGEASPVLADLDGDDENELVIANSDGVVHALEREGGEVEGFPARVGPLPDHPQGRAFATGAVERGRAAVLATPAVGDLDRDGVPEIVVADLEGEVTIIGADGAVRQTMQTSRAYAGIPPAPFVNTRKGELNRTQLGFIGSPVLADLDGDGDQEIVAAAMDRHVYAWHHDGSAVAGWPVLVVDRSKVAAIDPDSHQVTFKDGAGADHQQGAIIDTPAVGDLTGDGRPEIVVGTNESYAEEINAGGLDQAIYAVAGLALSPANGRLFALKATGGEDAVLPGWPFKVGILQAGVLPLVGEGITGSPVIGDMPCNGITPGVRVGTIPAAGLPYLINPDGTSCYGRVNGLDRALPTTGGAAVDPVFLPAFGHPALGGGRLLAPAAGLVRALDVVLPEYQGGRDYLVAWDTALGVVAPGWPAEVNDLQFLTGPAVADLVPGVPGQEVLEGTASDDLQGFTALGTDLPGFPKLTGDWTVSVPAVGTWGGGSTKVVVSLTRSGRVLAYRTGANACAPADWPQFHHDPANSGDARRDAVPPGRVRDVSLTGDRLTFAPAGDDLRCGSAARHEVVTAPAPDLAGARAVDQDGPRLAGPLERYVAVRGVDEQGNAGRWTVVDRGAGAPGTPGPAPAPSGGSAPPAGCEDGLAPRSRFTGRRATRRALVLRGRTRERGACGTPIRHVLVAVARIGGDRCRPLRRSGRLGSTRSCRRKAYLRASGKETWKLRIRGPLRPGRYLVFVRARDANGNFEARSKSNRMVLRVPR